MRYRSIFFAVFFVLLSTPSFAHALTVKSIRLTPRGQQTTIAITLDGHPATYKAFILDNPPRLAIDLPSFDWQAGKVKRPDNNIVTGLRQGALTAVTSRIVFDLRSPAAIQAKASSGRGATLTITLAPATDSDAVQTSDKTANNAAAVEADIAGDAPVASAIPAKLTAKPAIGAYVMPADARPAGEKPPPVPDKPLIVIDPGHGGIDPGTHGPHLEGSGDIVEKTVTLANARALRDALTATGHYRVLLTRDSDTYLYLPQRVAFARKHHADLFISLHADASPVSDQARGASVYTLSENASDAETAKLAAKENRADQVAGMDLTGQDDDVAGILVDLAMRNTMNQGNFLANTVASTLHAQGIPVLERPHRAAGFAVLKDPDVPSILVEMGFLSNPQQAEALSSPEFQQQLAAALTASLDAYFAKIRDTAH